MCSGFGKPKGRRRRPEFVRKERLEVRTIPLREETIRRTVVAGPRLTFPSYINRIIRSYMEFLICVTQTRIFAWNQSES